MTIDNLVRLLVIVCCGLCAAGAPADLSLQHEDVTWRRDAARNLSHYRTSLLSKVVPLLNNTGYDLEGGWGRFTTYFPTIVTCPPSQPLILAERPPNPREPAKYLCNMDLHQKGCIIYSLGSNGEFGFEESMLSKTDCEIHTFDCTYDGRGAPKTPRVIYHEWCVGMTREEALANKVHITPNAEFYSYTEIVRKLGHKEVDVLKIDIEGSEMVVLPDALQEGNPGLPLQISIELHFYWPHINFVNPPRNTQEMAMLFMHLASVGYAAVAYEPNMHGSCCAEYTFILVGKGRWLAEHQAGLPIGGHRNTVGTRKETRRKLLSRL